VGLQHRGRVVGPGVDDDVRVKLAGQRELLVGDVFAAGIVLYGGAVPVTGPDAKGAVYRGDPYLPVADRFHPGVLGDGLDQGFHIVIEGDDIQPDLVQQRHLGPAGPGGELAELPAETTDLGHGQAVRSVVD
jgi:hypothetical protein